MTEYLWTIKHIVQATQGVLVPVDSRAGESLLPPHNPPITGMSIDSRTLQPRDMFIALSGPNFDGHDYVLSAFERGASVALVSRSVPCAIPQIVVRDTQQALIQLGQYRVGNSTAKIVAITGSVGKTGTKEALYHMLSQQGKTHATAGNLNNHIGLPLSMARMPWDTDYGIFELGMNHPGELRALTTMLCPHVAVITAIAPVHLQFFDSVAHIAHAKAEIWAGLGKNAPAIMPLACPHHDILKQAALKQGLRCVICGSTPDCDVVIQHSIGTPSGSKVWASIGQHAVTYTIGIPGQNWIDNSLLILAVLHEIGADIDAGLASLATLSAPAGRGERLYLAINNTPICVLDDSYNASVTSMQNAIGILHAMPAPRRVAVLGDMLELGPASAALHQQVGHALANSAIDCVHAIGQDAQNYLDFLPSTVQGYHHATVAEAIPHIISGLQDHDALLVKGSLGSHVHTIVSHLKSLSC